jgi:putative AlgH/UPF0301 family transcriptional regulator
MKRAVRLFAVLLAMVGCATSLANDADLSRAVTLVATDRLDGSPFQQTVIIAAPLQDGTYVGFIINRPTDVKLATLFPDDPESRKVDSTVSYGGPMLSRAVFALTSSAPAVETGVVNLMPGLFAVMNAAGVDRVIETTPNDARYFIGLVVWAPDELNEQVTAGVWDVKPADPKIVLRGKSPGLWGELRGPKPKGRPEDWV